jgi:hypothetical protein
MSERAIARIALSLGYLQVICDLSAIRADALPAAREKAS